MGERSTWLDRWHPAWVGVLAFALYAPTIRYGYVAYDDPWLLRDNHLLREPSLDAIWRILTDFSWEQRHRLGAEYLPLRDLSVMLDYAIYGDWVGGLHLTQVVLYAICCALAAALTLVLFERRALAWLSGLFFAVHPVHVEAVAWLSERKGILSAVLVFASLLCGAAALRRGGGLRAASACILFLLAVAAKAVTIASAGALALMMLWLDSPVSTRKKLGFLGAYAASGLLAFAPYLWVARSFGVVAAEGGGPLDSLMTFFQAHSQYLKLMAFGGPYAIGYGIDAGSATLMQWLPGALGAAAGVAAVVWALVARSKRTSVTFGLGWWLVFLVPASHLFATIQNLAADRYVFLPSYGLLLAAAALILKLPPAPRWVLATSVTAFGLIWTAVQTPVWASSERLFENAVEVAPNNVDAWDKLASGASERNEPDAAWDYTLRGLAHAPDDWRLLHRQGLILSEQGQIDAAIDVMGRAASAPEAHKAYANLALLHLRRGNEADALRAAEEAVRLEPRATHNQRVLGIVTHQMGDLERACRAFETAYRLDPYDEANEGNIELCGIEEDDGRPDEGGE